MRFTLQASGLDDLVLGDCDTEFGLRYHDLGAPAPREVVQDAPDTDGTLDQTALEGGRTITAVVQIKPVTFTAEQRLKAFTHPRIRATLLIDDDVSDAPARQATVRGIPFMVEVDVDRREADQRLMTCQWSVPSGILESAVEEVFEVAAASGGGDGLDWPVVWPIEWGTASVIGVIEVTNLGDRDAFPILQLHGPWSGVTRVENLTTGKVLVFDGESVLVDNYIEVDTRAKTIYLNGLTTQSRYHRLDFPDSDWFTLVPGVNTLRFLPAVSSSPARLAGRYRHAYS